VSFRLDERTSGLSATRVGETVRLVRPAAAGVEAPVATLALHHEGSLQRVPLERREWSQYAFDTREKAHIGRRSREWTAVGPTEEGVVREMARCLPRDHLRPGAAVTDAALDVLVISGPAGVGKTTLAHEVSRQLSADGVGHAVIDTDELDHIYPAPAHLASLTEQSLRAVWSVLSAHGARRLILVGVHLDRDDELRWVSAAVPGAVFTRVRLTASPETLGERILRREVGTGAADQLERTMAQLASLGRPGDDVRALPTDGRSPRELAAAVIALWRPAERVSA